VKPLLGGGVFSTQRAWVVLKNQNSHIEQMLGYRTLAHIIAKWFRGVNHPAIRPIVDSPLRKYYNY
jgi:hypothetical protein